MFQNPENEAKIDRKKKQHFFLDASMGPIFLSNQEGNKGFI